MPAAEKERSYPYVAAVTAVALATAIRVAMSPLVGTRVPWIFFFPAVAFAAWRSGSGAALLALVLSTLVGWYAWIPPAMSFSLKGPQERVLVLLFLISGSFIVAFGRSNERTRLRLADELERRERASRELAESLESFRSVFEHAQGDAVALLDAEARVVAWNPGAARTFGIPSDEALRGDFAQIFAPEERAAGIPAREVARARAGGSALEPRWYARPDGTRFWGVGSLVALHRDDGAVRGYLVVVRDESERREVEEANRRHAESLERHVAEATADLRAANAELEGFTYSVSHDMRAPLRAIVGHAVVLMEDHGDVLPEDARMRIERMSKASTRMSRLIEDLLAYARLNKQALKKADLDLAALFREVVAQEAGGIEVEAYAPQSLPVEAEPGLMRMVLENLVGNAIKYRRPDVPLRLKFTLVDHEGQCGYALRDNGTGFEMRYVGKLFEPFERLHRTEDVEGTGIGLANVRRIVERHGGTVWAEGEPGVGSTFGFTLP